jgi:hypothetical protein
MSLEEQQETLNRFKESPQAEELLPSFMELVFG